MNSRNDTPVYRSFSSYLINLFKERTHRISLDAGFGCPHRDGGRGSGGCIFCSPSGSGSGAHDRGLSVKEQIAAGADKLSRKGIKKYIAYFQAFCNTNADPEILRDLYLDAVSHEGVVGLYIGTRPDMLGDDVLSIISDFATGKMTGAPLDVWLELGLQTANDETLKLIQRGHDTACFDDAVIRATKHGISVASHIILGLPGETKKDIITTAEHIANLPLKGLKLHHLYIEKGAPLAKLYKENPFPVLTLAEYIELVIAVLRRQKQDLVVMRMAGWSNKNRLIAPNWDLHPSIIVQRITEEMRKRRQCQGDLCQH